MCSIAHLRAISELNHIAQFADDARPELLTDAQRKLVQEHCARALEYCAAYAACAACGGKNCPHHPASLDAPPPPDTAFFH